MLKDSVATACFSTDDIAKTKEFYNGTLGVPILMDQDDAVAFQFANGTAAFIYLKEDHVPAAHTVLILTGADVEAEVADLKSRGVVFADLPYTDDDGITREEGMPKTAWFQDPSGNWVAVGENFA
ncbi:VOC family protein [Demequina rhizosphaerae]|uniref:VOC family protein n=1 Tax=Demequina rhizosphaerae TaxID=1638985 RepID=UPI00078422BB|nr:VOC family protein [Demequina rhizosphaerae]